MEISIEIFGGVFEDFFGSYVGDYQEVVFKIVVCYWLVVGIGVFLKEIMGLGFVMLFGLCVFVGGWLKFLFVICLFFFLFFKEEVSVCIYWGGEIIDYMVVLVLISEFVVLVLYMLLLSFKVQSVLILVFLIQLVYGCSGDKGDKVNIGIIVCQFEYLFYIWVVLIFEVVVSCFLCFFDGWVECFFLFGIYVINFVLYDVFGGGGIVSLRNDV